MPRNVSGTYTLPLPPVVANTVIQAAWANSTTDDIAQGITDSLDRQGRGGMIAPFRLTDGTVLQPAWAFSAETGTGMYRESAGVLSLAVMGVKVGQFAAAGFKANLVGPFSVSGDIGFTGNVNVAGRALFADGTQALPSISFTSDPDTGFYKSGVGQIALVVDGNRRLYADANSVQIINSPTASAPSLVVFSNQTGGGPGYAIDILGSGVATDKAIVRWLNSGYTLERLSITTDNTTVDFNVPGALPMRFFTSNTLRMTIAAAGQVTFTNDVFGNTKIVAPNIYVGQTSASAGTVGIEGGLGAATVYWGTTSAGAGSLDLVASGQRQVNISSPGATANLWNITGSVAGQRVTMQPQGTDANIGLQWTTKGTGDHLFLAGGVGGVMLQLTGGGNTWVSITGNTGVAPNYPVLSSNAAKLTIPVPLKFFGPLSVTADITAAPVSQYTQASFATFTHVDGSRAANNKIAEMLFTSGGYQARFLNDAGTDARTIWNSNGGVASGVVNTLFYTGANDLTLWLASGGAGGNRGLANFGTTSPFTQLQVSGLGQSDGAGNVFDPDIVPTTVGSTLYLLDTGTAAGSGGCIMFEAFSGTQQGRHFASIKSYITDAGGRSAGELRFNLKNTSADTGSTQVLRLTANRGILDSRDLGVGRDIGTNLTAPNCPIGSIIVGAVPGFNLNSLSTVNAAATNITMYGIGTGSNTTVNIGTWRAIGALSSSSNTGLWIRTA